MRPPGKMDSAPGRRTAGRVPAGVRQLCPISEGARSEGSTNVNSHTLSDACIRGNLTIMQRRGFIATMGAPVFHRSNGQGRVYRAVAAAHMPAFLTCESGAGVVEVRRYEGAAASAETFAQLLERHGAHVIAREELSFLLGFPSLEARQSAWASLTSDADWPSLRNEAALIPREVSVYVCDSVSI